MGVTGGTQETGVYFYGREHFPGSYLWNSIEARPHMAASLGAGNA